MVSRQNVYTFVPNFGTNRIMSKGIKKYQNYNAIIVKKVAENFGYSERYVRACLKKDRNGVMSDAVQKEYRRLVNVLHESLNK